MKKYVHILRNEYIGAKRIVCTRLTLSVDNHGKPTTIDFDFVEGSALLVIGSYRLQHAPKENRCYELDLNRPTNNTAQAFTPYIAENHISDRSARLDIIRRIGTIMNGLFAITVRETEPIITKELHQVAHVPKVEMKVYAGILESRTDNFLTCKRMCLKTASFLP